MAEGKKSFILYLTQRPTFEGLTDEDAGKLIKTIFSYVCDENPEPEGIVKYAFEIVKPILKADLVKYEDKRTKLKENISKRWNTKEQEKIQMNTNEYNSKQIDGVIVNDIVIDNVNDNVSKDNKENIRVINNTIKENTPNSRFSKPSVEEIKAYCDERGNNIDPYEFYDFYESKNWFVGKSKMKDWKACIRTWERKRGFKPGDNDDDEKIEIVNGKRYVAGFEML